MPSDSSAAPHAASNATILVAGAVGSYELALVARVLGGLAHAGMFSVAIATAVALAPRGKAGRAVAVVNLGVTAALTLGVPLGTAAGTAWGWRGVFAAVAVALLAVAAVARVVLPASDSPRAVPGPTTPGPTTPGPTTPGPTTPGSRAAGSPAAGPTHRPSVLRALAHRPLLHVAVVTAVLALGHYTADTSVAPLVLHAGIGAGDVGPVLLVHGLASLPGLLLAGLLADRHPDAALRSAIALAALCLFVMAALPGRPVALVTSIAVWGLAFGALPSLLQTAALRVSPSRDAAPAIVNAMFNVGIAAGAWTGGRLVLRDVTSVAPTGAGITLLALVLALLLLRRTRRGAMGAAPELIRPAPPAGR